MKQRSRQSVNQDPIQIQIQSNETSSSIHINPSILEERTSKKAKKEKEKKDSSNDIE